MKLNSFEIYFSLVLVLWIKNVRSQACSSTDLTDDEFEWGIDPIDIEATYAGTIITYQMQNTRSIQSTENSNMNSMYIDAELIENNVLRIFTTDMFANYEKIESIPTITLIITLSCTSGESKLYFRQRIEPNNNHAPFFSQQIYEMKILLPMPKGFDLTFYMEISARDIDLVNNRVTFSTPDVTAVDVGTSTQIGTDGKTFYATLVTNQQILTIRDKLEITIIATDSGQPETKSATAQIIIVGDDNISYVSVPKFEQQIYRGLLDNDYKLIMSVNPKIDIETFSDQVSFDLIDGDRSLFTITNESNELTVTLAKELSEVDVQGKSYLSSTLVANNPEVDSGYAVLLVDIQTTTPAPTIPVPRFEKSLFKGAITKEKEFQIEDIVLVADTFSSDVTFTIEEETTLFTISNEQNVVKLLLSRSINDEDIEGDLFLTFNIVATNSISGPGRTAVLIDLPEPIPAPKFEKILYNGLLNEDAELTIEPIVLLAETYTDNVVFTLDGADSSLFTITNDLNTITLTIKSDQAELIEDRSFLLINILARNEKLLTTGDTSVLININHLVYAVPMFEKSVFNGNINDENQLIIESIVLNEDTYTSDILFELEGDDSVYFNFINIDNIISVSLIGPISEENLKDKLFLTFIVIATHPISGESAEAVVLISLPEKPCIIDCPECPSLESSTPVFENKNYRFFIQPSDVGKIGEVVAVVDATNAPRVSYAIEFTNNDYLATRLTINPNTGELLLSDKLISGLYNCQVVATITINDIIYTGKATIQITVDIEHTCPGSNVTVNKFIQIKYLKENEEHKNIISTQISDCFYSILKISPNNEEYFKINYETNMLESISLDRESSIFSNYELPQIQITLKLICETDALEALRIQYNNYSNYNSLSSEKIRSIEPNNPDDGRWYILTNEMDYAQDISIITVIIQDENDNYPIFVKPKLKIGYPEQKLAEQILPPYLMTVQATDLDAGLNAKIKYSLAENQYFEVNGESGVIFPVKNSQLKSSEIIEVHAVDRDGAADGLRTTIKVLVKLLEIKHLTVVTMEVKNQMNVDDVVDGLIKESGIEILVLHSAIIPISNDENSKYYRANEQVTALRLIVYAFDGNDELIDTTELQRTLNSIPSATTMSVLSYESTNENDNSSMVEDNFILLIVIAVLSSVLLISIITTFFMWWFKIRPYEYKTAIDDGTGSSQENLRNENNDLKVESSPPMNAARFGVDDEKRDSVMIVGSTLQESNDDQFKLARSLSSILDDENRVNENNSDDIDRKDRRKSQSVTFNEMVERIDIETDDQHHTADDDTDERF